MEKTSPKTPSSFFSLADFVGFLLFQKILNCLRCQKLYYKFICFCQTQIGVFFTISTTPNSDICGGLKKKSMSSKHLRSDENEIVKLNREDVEMVMGKLGMFCNPDGEELRASFSLVELSVLFEEKEPSLEEVKEAFSVFDCNGDGFIDAEELQRVLCKLGFKEGSNIDACERMIRAFDENGDNKIDFGEFVKFMENSFY